MAIMQNALIGGMLVGFVASYYGVFIVQRRMAFLGNGLSHAAFGGVALGILIGYEPVYVAVPFTLAMAIAIVWIRENSAIAEDTAIGVLFAVSMALGGIFYFAKEGYGGDLFSYLFGSILMITVKDVWLATAMAAATAATIPLWGAWAYATFDRDLARTDRLRVVWHDYTLACAIAVAVVVSIKIVGMLLVAAFLVLPAATARIVSQSLRQMTVLSVAIGTVTPAIGLYISYLANLPPGATIILVQAALFALALAVKRAAQ